MSPPRVSGAFDGTPYDEHQVRQLEMTVLTQLRDSMALTNTALAKLGDKVDNMHSLVTSLAAARYDVQIDKMEGDARERVEAARVEMQRQIDVLTTRCNSHGERLTNYGNQLARMGAGMAVSAAVGSLALGAIIVIVVGRVFGAHV